MEMENSSSQEEADHAGERKGPMTTVASTYFDEKIAVPKTEGVSRYCTDF